VSPDTICFSAAINAWARSDGVALARRVEILDRMQELNVQPDTFTFTSSVNNAWTKSGDPSAIKS
jgi:hypothetical protein